MRPRSLPFVPLNWPSNPVGDAVFIDAPQVARPRDSPESFDVVEARVEARKLIDCALLFEDDQQSGCIPWGRRFLASIRDGRPTPERDEAFERRSGPTRSGCLAFALPF